MTDEPIPKEDLEEQSGEELPDPDAASLGDPEDFPVGDLPKGAPKEPGLPPPRD
jgi:hypothetical protein